MYFANVLFRFRWLMVLAVVSLTACAAPPVRQGPYPSRTASLPSYPPADQEAAAAIPAPPPLPTQEPAETDPEQSQARTVASLQLVDEARLMIAQQRFDDAIRVLEQAININPTNGDSYYYLAEAWRQKGHLRQAADFNRLALRYHKDDRHWRQRIERQREQILAADIN